MELQLSDEKGAQAGSVSVADNAFAVPFREALVHQVVTAYLAGGRAGTKAQKSRAEVSGGGSKPWRQKGTGRARAGTIRSPIWRAGGRTFAARPRDHGQKVNRKMYRGALRSILSELARQERLRVLESFTLDAARTRELKDRLGTMGLERALIVVDQADDALLKAARNLPGVEVVEAGTVDPVSLVGAETVVATVPAVRRLEEWLA